MDQQFSTLHGSGFQNASIISHAADPTALSQGFRPTRLIDLGSAATSIKQRLILTAFLGNETGYATLFYCLGTRKFIRLTKDFLESMFEYIQIAELSTTFREAMEAARPLGFRYLWIDSLCIIQNDDEGWRNEASLMADIYEASQLNIAATQSTSGEGGCFASQNSE